MKTFLISFVVLAALVAQSGPFDSLSKARSATRREIRTDYDTIPGKVIHWYSDGTARTNTPKRVDFVICTNKVENTIISLDAESKVTRDVKGKADKAKKKEQKTFENWVKDTKKAMNKSSTQEMKDFFQSVLDLAGSVSQ